MPITEQEFILAFFQPEEQVFVRMFSDRKDKKVRPKAFSLLAKEFESRRNEMLMKNLQENCGVHFTVNFGGQADKDITRVNAVFFENDKLPIDQQLEQIAQSPLEPSIIVKTRKSLHTYFLTDDVPVKKFRSLQERLAFMFDADPQVKNESHTMRMPNFYHTKTDHLLVQVIKFDPHLRYRYAEINAVLPKAPPKPKKKPSIGVNLTGSADQASILEYVRRKLEISYEKEDKIICHCLFPDRHANGDRVPSAVFFKEKMGFYCSGCGTYQGLYELAQSQQWLELLTVLERNREAKRA